MRSFSDQPIAKQLFQIPTTPSESPLSRYSSPDVNFNERYVLPRSILCLEMGRRNIAQRLCRAAHPREKAGEAHHFGQGSLASSGCVDGSKMQALLPRKYYFFVLEQALHLQSQQGRHCNGVGETGYSGRFDDMPKLAGVFVRLMEKGDAEASASARNPGLTKTAEKALLLREKTPNANALHV